MFLANDKQEIFNCEKGSYMRLIWSRHRKEVLECAHQANIIEPKIKESRLLKQLYNRCQNNLTDQFRKELSNYINNGYISPDLFMKNFVEYKCTSILDEELNQSWEKLFILRNIGKLCNLDEKCFPCDKDLITSLDDQEFENNLLERFSIVLPFVQALILQLCATDFSKKIIDGIGSTFDQLKQLSISSLEDVCNYYDFLDKENIKRNKISEQVAKFRSKLESMNIGAYIPCILQCLEEKDDFSLLASMEKQHDTIRQEIIKAFETYAPTSLDIPALRELLTGIEPPLIKGDMGLATEELDRLESGELAPSRSHWLTFILPVMRREVAFDEELLPVEYSRLMSNNLRDGIYRLPSYEGSVGPGCDSSDEESVTIPPYEKPDQMGTFEENEGKALSFGENNPSAEDGDDSLAETATHEEKVPSGESTTGAPIKETLSGISDDSIASTPSKESANIPEAELNHEKSTSTDDNTDDETIPSDAFIPPDPKGIGGLLSGVSPESNIMGHTEKKESSIRKRQKKEAVVPLEDAIAAVAEEHEGIEFPKYSPSDSNWNKFFDGLIESRDTCALYWMSRALGEKSPIPVWLSELLHLGIRFMPMPTSLATRERIIQICGEFYGNIYELSEENKILLAVALLRPSLMKPDYAAMMPMVSTLGSSGVSSVFRDSRMFDEVLSVMRVGKAINAIGWSKTQLETQKESLARETREFLNGVRSGKLSYQPASQVRRNLFSSNGLVGRQLQQCLDNNYSGLTEFVSKYSDSRAIDGLINNDKAVEHNTRKIEAVSKRKLTDDVTFAVQLLSQWDTYLSSAKNSGEADPSQDQFHAIQSSMPIERLKNYAAGRCLIEQVNTLTTLNQLQEPCGNISELELWPMRIPCICGDDGHNSPMESLAWSINQKHHKDDGAVCASLIMHAARGRLDMCKRFFNCYAKFREYGEHLNSAKEMLRQWAPSFAESMPESPWTAYERSVTYWNDVFSNNEEKIKLEISDCYFRGAISYAQQGKCNAECSSIVSHSDENVDKRQSIKQLEKLSEQLKKWDGDKLSEVLQHINNIKMHNHVEKSVKDFLGIVENRVNQDRVYTAAWHNIARAQEHMEKNDRLLPDISGQGNVVPSAASLFYQQIADGPIKCINADKEALWNIPQKTRQDAVKMRQDADKKYLGKLTELLRVLRFNLNQNAKPEYRKREGKPNSWDLIRFSMTLESPLPLWGSQSNGSHTVALGWNVQADHIDRLMRGGDIMHDEALTLLCFNEFGLEERAKLLRMSREWPTFPIVIDTNMYNFISAREGRGITEAMFQIALAGAPHNPYTPDVAGAVPPEMFYGREEDKKKILDMYGSCIIYGGRQLGKSALLRQIATLDTPDFKVLMHPMDRAETSLLNAVLTECRNADIVGPNTSSRTLREKIGEWLNAKPGRRLLVLLDECDNALEEDSNKGSDGREFPDVMELRTIMEETGRRFKVVFTGLHSVQRFSNTVNNPLYHYGEPVPIGPLSTPDAYDLMTKPLSLLGMEFENQQLVQMALNHCNYQPKLIQMFCRELISAIDKNRSHSNEEECWHYLINRETMLKVYKSRNLQQKIMECFKMTMDLDERYLVIGYTMSLQQDDGMTLGNLLDELRAYWPAAFDIGDAARQNTQSLLEEMEGLGLVISLGGKYRLRTPNIVELLGGEEHVFEELGQYYNKQWQPKGDPDELRVEGAETFVATQYNLLADSCSRLIWVTGSDAMGLNKVPEALEHIEKIKPKGSTLRVRPIKEKDVPSAMKFVRQEYGKITEGGVIFWLSSKKFPYMESFMRQAEDWLSELHTDRKFVKIVCMIGPQALYECIRSGFAEEFSSMQMLLRPWTLNSIDRRCREMTQRPQMSAQEIMDKTGGWSCLVEKALLGQTFDSVNELAGKNILFPENIPELEEVLRLFLDFDEPIPEEILVGNDGLANENTVLAVELLQRLYVLRKHSNMLEIERIAAQALKRDIT